MDEKYLDSLIEEYYEAGKEFDEISEQKKKAKKKMDKIAQQLYQTMETHHCEQYRHEKYGLVYLSGRPWAKITDEEKAFQFLRENGIYDDIMYLAPHSGRLNEFFTENYIKKQEPIPMDIGIEILITPTIRKSEGSIKPKDLKFQKLNEGGSNC